MKKNVKNLILLTFNLNPFKIANFILHQAYDVHTLGYGTTYPVFDYIIEYSPIA